MHSGAPSIGSTIDRVLRCAPTRPARILALVIFGLAAAWMVRKAASAPAVTWMNIYAPGDFSQVGAREIATFMWQLRVPIPPALALVEIVAQEIPHAPILLSTYGYRAALILVYVLAIVLASTSMVRMLAAAAVSLLFLYCTTLIHRGNAQVYDILCPLFFLLFVVLLRAAAEAKTVRLQILLPAAAGFFLSMAELTRPFLVAVLPLFVVCGALSFARATQRRSLIAFLVPIILLSGGWHAHLWFTHGQLTFSNHTGFNLRRAWPQVTVPELEPELGVPIASGRWPNLNTTQHLENSRRLQKAVAHYWREQPTSSLEHAVRRTGELLSGQTAIYQRRPQSAWFGAYRWTVRITAVWLMVQITLLAVRMARRRSPTAWARMARHPDHLVLAFAGSCIFFLAVGERGEDARFLLSLLPLLAALPLAARVAAPGRAARGATTP